MADPSANAINTNSSNDFQEKAINASLDQTDAAQQQQTEKIDSPMNFLRALTNNLPPKLTRDQIRAGFKQLDDNAVTKDWNDHNHDCNVLFTHVPDEFVVGIPYDKTTTPVNDVAEAIHAAFPFPKAIGLDMHTRGVAYLIFDKDEDRMAALDQKTIAFTPSPLPILPTVLSKGRKITIRTDYIPIHRIAERRERLQELFAPFGNIIHIASQRHTVSKLNNQATIFTLEVNKESPEDLLIPRVAPIKGCNVLFSWSGSQFCFRCGSPDHLKVQCPLPLNYDLAKEDTVNTPILARAFPDPKAPLRKVYKTKTSEESVSVAKTAASNDLLTDGFREQRSGKKRRKKTPNSLLRAESDHASESDSVQQPATKKGPHLSSKESSIVDDTVLIRRRNSHSVADVPTPMSAPLPLGLQNADNTSAPELSGEAVLPPPNPSVDVAGESGGMAGLTTPVPGGPQMQEAPGDSYESPGSSESKETPQPTPSNSSNPQPLNMDPEHDNEQIDMDGIEYTEAEQRELNDPNTTQERKNEIKALVNTRKPKEQRRQDQQRRLAKSLLATNSKLDNLTKATRATKPKKG